MNHFQTILSQVRMLLSSHRPSQVQALLDNLLAEDLLSREYHYALLHEPDGEALARKISLTLMEKGDPDLAPLRWIWSGLQAPEAERDSGYKDPGDNSDLIACTVITKDGSMLQRFLAVDIYQMSLVEPDVSRLGWGVVKFAGLLQDMQVTGVEDDSRALNITIHKPASSPHSKPFPILQATFVFSDHIRCIIAKQRLAKGRIQARRMKMQRIAALLDLPIQPTTEVLGFGLSSSSTQHLPFRFYDQCRRGSSDPTVQRSVFASVDKVPGFAVAQCMNQHSSSSLSSPSPSASGSPSVSGSASHCDSGGARSSSSPSAAQSPADDPMTVEQLQPNLPDQLVIVSETEAEARPSKSLARSADVETVNLCPSLIPAQQPTISLLCEDTADTLSVESLTLIPPVDPHSLRTLTGIPPPPTPATAGTGTPGEGAAQPEPAGPAEH
ncbi:protein CLEC16A-like [Physeter macrocephalus]|uniref:Protein CLEC16A-like n=1 Tax=Physeter macrocephalus TaxID=9755 RepID=A0A9W2X2V3_PHYMC|nr:protein CLEC16A-like [Physeter catodon]